MHFVQITFVAFICIISSVVNGAPSVVVTIKPLHSLVTGVMEGVAEPYLLLKGDQSAHHLTLKPSQAKEIHNADLLVWVGPAFETFLSRIVQSEALSSLVLMSAENIVLLPTRDITHQDEAAPDHGEVDGHIWLNPRNAIGIVQAVVARLVDIDDTNGHLYRKNGRHLEARLVALDAMLERRLKRVQGIPYLTYHDSLQYFEQRYGLTGYAVTTLSELRSGVKGVIRVRRLISEKKISCLFREPQFRPKLLDVLMEELSVRDGVIDPLGAEVSLGSNGYFVLMERMARAFEQCLIDGA
ncbi:MAG: zinc ABC transporter substrate-binding protein [Candidatus Polarisedimenticolaceae bacterium]|nr:zinc ABC transporter substrate-binding protein [Candidatus Polarisedimenticolaceae bacterium]